MSPQAPTADAFIDVGFQTEGDLLSVVQTDEIAGYNQNPPYWSGEAEQHAPLYTFESLQQSTMNAYPKSTQLYLSLGEEFGFHNIAPVPTWLSDANDLSHKQWYKSGPNAFLYFLHRSPKYKKQLAEIAKTSICCSCKPCIRGKMGNILTYHTNTRYCALFWCDGLVFLLTILPLCFYWITCDEAAAQYRRFYGGEGSRIIVPFGTTPSWPWMIGSCDDGALEFRYELLKQLKESGVEIDLPWYCTLWWQYACCTPCVNIHNQNILDYYFYKRYGFNLDLNDEPNKVEEHIFGHSYSQWRSELTLYAESVQSERGGNIYNKFVRRSRENNPFDGTSESNDPDAPATGKKFLCGPFPSYPMFTEWTNFDKAVEYHNQLWGRNLN